jgi:hypothetical protein
MAPVQRSAMPLRRLILALALSVAPIAAPAANAAPPSWSPPRLTSPRTVELTVDRRWYNLDPTRDYVLKLPRGTYDRGGLVIEGGDDVTLIGGHIWVPETGTTNNGLRRGLMLANQRGTIHVEGLRIDGPGLSEGIQMEQRYGSRVQLQRIFVGTVRARDTVGFTDNHPDVVQTWAGPKQLLIDGLSGTTTYQGMFLAPVSASCRTKACQPNTEPGRRWDFRNVDIRGTATARIIFWKDSPFPISLHDVWGSPAWGRPVSWSVWPNPTSWNRVIWRARSERMVPHTEVGPAYRRPSAYRY